MPVQPRNSWIPERIQLKQPLSFQASRSIDRLVCGLILASLLVSTVALGQYNSGHSSSRLENPRGVLNQPFDSPIFLGAYGQLGGGLDHDQGQLGYGAFFMFRPGSASNFFRFLHDWNSSLVLQADYQKVSADSRILSGDLIIRHYLKDMRDDTTAVSPFFGAGIGASEVLLPPEEPITFQQYWSGLLEIGQEWNWRPDKMVFIKGQFRYYSFGGYNYSTWSLQAGAGIPLPW